MLNNYSYVLKYVYKNIHHWFKTCAAADDFYYSILNINANVVLTIKSKCQVKHNICI